ncbi:MAG: hypothetical protein JNK87_32040 [Bryobacterales bacterium]|nr:hypothetical protein [Bryobacterales bacterium]
MRFPFLFVTISACVLAVGPASGAITTYSNTEASATNYNTDLTAIRNLWEAGVSGLQNVTFGINGAGQYNSNAAVINPGNTVVNTFTDCSLAASNLGATQVCLERRNAASRTSIEVDIFSPVPAGNRFFFGDSGSSNGIGIALAPGVRAFALDLYTLFGAGSISVSMYDTGGLAGQITVGTTNNGVPAYLGVTSDTVLTSLLVTSSTRSVAVDTISFANALGGGGGGGNEPPPNTDTPESATLGYIGMGLLALLASRKHARA